MRRFFRSPFLWVVVGAVLAVVAAVVLFLALRGDASSPDYEFATDPYRNGSGGYTFNRPPGWKTTSEGTTTKVVSPDRSVVITLGRGAEGSLVDASEIFAEQIEKSYRSVHFSAGRAERIGGYPAVLVSGSGWNPKNLRIRFVAITIQGPDGNYSIAVFTPYDVDAMKVLPPVQEIVGSFRPLA